MNGDSFLVVRRQSGGGESGRGPVFMSENCGGGRFRWSRFARAAMRFELAELAELLELVRGRSGWSVGLVYRGQLVALSARCPSPEMQSAFAKVG